MGKKKIDFRLENGNNLICTYKNTEFQAAFETNENENTRIVLSSEKQGYRAKWKSFIVARYLQKNFFTVPPLRLQYLLQKQGSISITNVVDKHGYQYFKSELFTVLSMVVYFICNLLHWEEAAKQWFGISMLVPAFMLPFLVIKTLVENGTLFEGNMYLDKNKQFSVGTKIFHQVFLLLMIFMLHYITNMFQSL